MAETTTRSQLKKWFKNGCKPTESHFAAVFDSYIHKDDSLPSSQIEGLEELITRHAGISEEEAAALVEAHNESATAHGIGTSDDFAAALDPAE